MSETRTEPGAPETASETRPEPGPEETPAAAAETPPEAPAPGAAGEDAAGSAADDAAPPTGEPEESGEPEEPDPAAEEIAALKDRLLRQVAETENLRKRAARERADAERYAIAGFARDMAGAADDLARALDHLPESLREAGDAAALIEGLELTRRNLDAAFGRHGLTRIDPRPGEPFDHNVHEAMFELDAPGAEPGTVVQVVEAGYRIRDRLLRPARVGVAKRRAARSEKPDDEPAHPAKPDNEPTRPAEPDNEPT